MKLFSFLVTAYNLEEWMLKRCIDSIVAQNMLEADYEIIVVDDGSEQSPEALINSYQQAPIVFHRQPNRGLGAALNKALSLASGTYCLIVDGDDYLFPDSLSLLAECLRIEQPDILQTSFQRVASQDIETLPTVTIQYQSYPSGAHCMLTQNISGGNWHLFRLELVKQLGLHFPENILHEDEVFFTQLYLSAGKIITTNLPVYAYWFRPDSIVNNPSPDQVKRRIDDFLTAINLLQRYEQQEELIGVRAQALQRKLHYLGVDCLLKTLRADDTDQWFETTLPRLKQQRLYPLPPRAEVQYLIFTLLIQWSMGRQLLRRLDNLRSKKL